MDEKKKLIIMLVLLGVMACIGGFQLLKKSGGAPPPPPVASTSPAPDAAASSSSGTGAAGTAPGAKAKDDPIKNPQFANELPTRNPFQVPADLRPHLDPTPTRVVENHHTHLPHMTGSLPPMGVSGELPALPTTVDAGPRTRGDGTAPEAPKPFDYKVVGVITGERPAVVLQDSSGKQKLVPAGAAIDGDSRVQSVENGAAWIESRGKKLRLNVGGTSVDNK